MKERKQNLKKGIVAVAMFLMVGLVIGMGAVTYSKYVTQAEPAKPQATAAKWGFVISADASDMFGSDYTKTDSATYSTKVDADGVSVSAASSVVAPGCEGSMTVTITGSAEVRAKMALAVSGTDISVDITEETGTTTYKPIKWTLSDDGGTTTIVEDVTLDDLVAAVRDLSADDLTFAPATSIDKTYTISWHWDFAGNDEADTVIGIAATENEELKKNIDTSKYTNINYSLDLTITASVEQIQ